MSIYDQLKNNCGCTAINQDDVVDMVNVISTATCWAMNPCETFLFSARKEVIDLPMCVECIYEFTPYYHPYDVESFSFKLVTVNGLEETITDIDFVYSEVDEVFRMDLGLDCQCLHYCGCPPKFKLLVEYDAGYEELPDCLIPVFCNVMELIEAKNNCDCDDCNCEGDTEVQYATGDVVTADLDTEIGLILKDAYKTQLSSISLCKYKSKIWGVLT